MGSSASIERKASSYAIWLVIINRVVISLEAYLQTVFAHHPSKRITEVEVRRGFVQHATIAKSTKTIDANSGRAAFRSVGSVRNTGKTIGNTRDAKECW